MANIYLILGGARSGKSRLAESRATQLAKQHDKHLVYVATAEAGDDEMASRITHHKRQRDESWLTIESPIELVNNLRKLANQSGVILVDCLTLWITNILCQQGFEHWQTAKKELINLLSDWDETKAELILVSNEVGHGIVPMGELSRQFVDESGWLHQAIAELAKQVDFVMAGLPLNLKSGDGGE